MFPARLIRSCSLSLAISESKDGVRSACNEPTIIAWLLVALAPTVKILDAETSVSRAVLMHQCLGELEDEHVP